MKLIKAHKRDHRGRIYHNILVVTGDKLKFSTAINNDVVGTVLSIDDDAEYRYRIEFIAPTGEKRINRFKASEFYSCEVIDD